MEISKALAASLHLLSAALDDPAVDLVGSLRTFTETAAAAVASYLGAVITIRTATADLRLEWFVDDQPALRQPTSAEAQASLLLRLPHPGIRDATSSLTLFARAPGAFVDLAADLAWLTGVGLDAIPVDQHLAVDLLRHDWVDAGAESIINQAIGALLVLEGLEPAEASIALDERAAAIGCRRLDVAQDVLSQLDGTGEYWR